MSRNPYVRPISITGWYWKHPRYVRYMSREITCIFIGALAVLMVCAIASLVRGEEAYQTFLSAISGLPWVLGLGLILIFSVHNATSWFNVTPKALPVQIGEEFLPGKFIIGAHYAVWVLVSVAVLYFSGV